MGGNLGIGTDSPSSAFHLKSNKDVAAVFETQTRGSGQTLSSKQVIEFRNKQSSGYFGRFQSNMGPHAFGFSNNVASIYLYGARTIIGEPGTPDLKNRTFNGSILLDGSTVVNGTTRIGGKLSDGNNSMDDISFGDFQMVVEGKLGAREVEIKLGSWADYVFSADYRVMPLTELEEYIVAHQHLPNVPSEQEVVKEGMSVGQMTKIQQEKIEELTLYIIQLSKRIAELEEKVQ